MSWREFALGMTEQVLSWPVVVLVIVLILLKPLRKLIDRIKTAKGFGGELEFQELLEDTEESILDGERAERRGWRWGRRRRRPGRTAPGADTAPSTGAVAGLSTAPSDIDSAGPATAPGNSDDPVSGTAPSGRAGSDPVDHEEERDTVVEGPIAEPYVPDPSRDPSGAIMMSWTALTQVLFDLRAVTAGPGRPSKNPRIVLDQLRKNDVISSKYFEAVHNLLALRNHVAHGEAVPTSGAARNYVELANQLRVTALSLIASLQDDLDQD
ncbi:hypothetical protein KZI27_17135 [Curtobacterium sp. TC1]|uniref:hypothetical protein n=1 Tax=Curtobacterium sp. TC1 TaxID=2862880 RepID=UPI001C9B3F0C|nr:hypothetical protein [Curtobacterium sp. TC1]QZQ54971.1 hypothetical protein KZI27_17135 [Curtobacterium sp. TC1]